MNHYKCIHLVYLNISIKHKCNINFIFINYIKYTKYINIYIYIYIYIYTL